MDSYNCEISKDQLSYISSHFLLQGFSWTVSIVRYPKSSWVISLHIFFFFRILYRVSYGQLQLCDIQRSAELYLFTYFFSEYSTGFVMDSYNCEISKDQLSYISLHIFFQNTRQGFSWTVTIVRYPKISWVISLHIFYFRILDKVSHGQLQWSVAIHGLSRLVGLGRRFAEHHHESSAWRTCTHSTTEGEEKTMG